MLVIQEPYVGKFALSAEASAGGEQYDRDRILHCILARTHRVCLPIRICRVSEAVAHEIES